MSFHKTLREIVVIYLFFFFFFHLYYNFKQNRNPNHFHLSHSFVHKGKEYVKISARYNRQSKAQINSGNQAKINYWSRHVTFLARSFHFKRLDSGIFQFIRDLWQWGKEFFLTCHYFSLCIAWWLYPLGIRWKLN